MRVLFDSRGTHGTVRSKGWNGDTLVLRGEARGKGGVRVVRETITKLGQVECKAVWEARSETGWEPYSIEHLTRVAE